MPPNAALTQSSRAHNSRMLKHCGYKYSRSTYPRADTVTGAGRTGGKTPPPPDPVSGTRQPRHAGISSPAQRHSWGTNGGNSFIIAFYSE